MQTRTIVHSPLLFPQVAPTVSGNLNYLRFFGRCGLFKGRAGGQTIFLLFVWTYIIIWIIRDLEIFTESRKLHPFLRYEPPKLGCIQVFWGILLNLYEKSGRTKGIFLMYFLTSFTVTAHESQFFWLQTAQHSTKYR